MHSVADRRTVCRLSRTDYSRPYDGVMAYCPKSITHFPVTSVDNLLGTSCNGIWETTQHRQTERTFARAYLLWTCYGESGVGA